MRSTDIAGGLLIALGLLMVLSAFSKFDLVRGGARWHPLFIGGSWRRRNAVRLTGGSLLADVVVAVLIPLYPIAAAVISAGLIGVYTAAFLSWTPRHERHRQCRCFAFSIAEATTRFGFIARNTLLIALAATIAVSDPAIGWNLSQIALAVGVLLFMHGLVTVADSLVGSGN